MCQYVFAFTEHKETPHNRGFKQCWGLLVAKVYGVPRPYPFRVGNLGERNQTRHKAQCTAHLHHLTSNAVTRQATPVPGRNGCRTPSLSPSSLSIVWFKLYLTTTSFSDARHATRAKEDPLPQQVGPAQRKRALRMASTMDGTNTTVSGPQTKPYKMVAPTVVSTITMPQPTSSVDAFNNAIH